MRSMQVADRINDIEKRAGRINLTLHRVCEDAGVDYGNLRRWKIGECSPIMSNFDSVITKLEKKLDEHETAIRVSLAEDETTRRRA